MGLFAFHLRHRHHAAGELDAAGVTALLPLPPGGREGGADILARRRQWEREDELVDAGMASTPFPPPR